MSVFSAPSFSDHELVTFCHDAETGLRAIIAVHDSTLGPALGGTRMWAYEDDAQALEDVLRLSKGMTYKAAVAGLKLGGGKAVIIGNAKSQKSEALLEAYGRFVDSLGGRYITAEDVGTSPADMEVVRRVTRHVVGTAEGGNHDGDPSPATAWGTFHGLRAAVAHRFGKKDLKSLTVAVQGMGHVGFWLARYLHEAGAKLVVTDIDQKLLRKAKREFGATVVEPHQIYGAKADVFAPCALGGVLNDDTIPQLKGKVVAGSANNQLGKDRHGLALRQRGILYAPDYVINAGGIIIISHEGPDYDEQAAFDDCAKIHDTLTTIFQRADKEDASPHVIADRMAEERLEIARKRKAPLPKRKAG